MAIKIKNHQIVFFFLWSEVYKTPTKSLAKHVHAIVRKSAPSSSEKIKEKIKKECVIKSNEF